MNYLLKRGLLLFVVLIITRFSLLFSQSNRLPNFIIIFVDDMGYGDLSCFGHPTIRTPNLDQMAVEGMRFTQFYVAANVCSPSRAALLTGRLPVRSGVYPDVFRPNSASGLPTDELTIAELLKTKGYNTAIVGKWHLGHQPDFLPTNQGFDYYFGIPYSNDMGKVGPFGANFDMSAFMSRNAPSPSSDSTAPTPPGNVPSSSSDRPAFSFPQNPPLPLYRNNEIIEYEPDQHQLTKRYTREVLDFIRANQENPFFIYYPNNFPHTPLYASDDFSGTSKRGLYGDVVQELDWSVGEILKELKALDLDENTLVMFTSDNGPWLMMQENGGSAGLLFEGKATTYEGGMREPMIAWWPGKIPANVINESLATSMDILPTIMGMAGIEMPTDREFDGMDIQDLLYGKKENIRDVIYYYHADQLRAIRKGSWKAHFVTQRSYSREPAVAHDPPLLYNLEIDPSEQYEVGAKHPDIIEEIQQLYDQQITTVIPAESETSKRLESAVNR